MPIPTKQRMIDWWGGILFEYYLCDETIGTTQCDSKSWLKYPGRVGRAMLGVLDIAGENGREVPVGEQGLVYFCGGPRFSFQGSREKRGGL